MFPGESGCLLKRPLYIYITSFFFNLSSIFTLCMHAYMYLTLESMANHKD